MATPTTSGQVSFASLSGNSQTDALIYGTKWGGGSGSAAVVTYSFPGYGSSWSTDWATGYGPSSSGREPWRGFAPLSVKTPNADFAEILSGKTPDLWHSNAPAKGGDTGAMFKKIIERALSMKATSPNTKDTKNTKTTISKGKAAKTPKTKKAKK